MATSIYPSQVRGDSTLLPAITSTITVAQAAYAKIDDWQYFAIFGTDPNFFIPKNRTKRVVPVTVKNLTIGEIEVDVNTNYAINGTLSRVDGGAGYYGAYTGEVLDQDYCSIQAKITSTAFTAGISLYDQSDTVTHDYANSQVRHAMRFGQGGIGAIFENGNVPSNNGTFKYKEGQDGMIEVKDGIAKYYLVDPDGTITLIRTTRSKLTEDARGEYMLYFLESALQNCYVFDNDFETTSYESIGVAYFRDSDKQLYWQKFENQRSSQSIGEVIEMADKRTQVTYPHPKRRLAGYGLTPKAFSIGDYWKFQDFVDYHDIAFEFLFIDYARKDLDGNPTELWAKFTGAFVDATRNGCQFEQSQAIIEDFRNDTTVPLYDTTPPEVEITDLTEGSAILTGTATDNVKVVKLELYQNGRLYGEIPLPIFPSEIWEFTVPTEDLVAGDNDFHVIAYDYAGNTTQSNTETLVNGSPDVEFPTIPTGLALNVISQTQINVSWNASTDNVGVTGYDLQRATNAGFSTGLVTINLGNVLSYNNTGLSPSTQYYYRVRAKDAANNYSDYSSSQNATTESPDSSAPSVPTGLTLNVISTSQINVSWSASTDNVAVTGYDLQRATSADFLTGLVTINLGNVLSYNNTGLSSGTQYYYRVRAHDAIPNNSAYSASQNATTLSPDVTAPSVPTEFVVDALNPPTDTSVGFVWTGSTDNVAVEEYEIQVATDSGFTTGLDTKTYAYPAESGIFTGLAPDTDYWFRIRAKDTSDNYSAYSAAVDATTAEVTSDLLLDVLGETALIAWGFRRLRTAYSGAALRVRRSTDNAEQDIGFVDDVLDWASAISFKGGGTLYITNPYNQSGSGISLSQATASFQPILDTTNQTVVFDGVDDHFTASLDLSTTNELTIFNVRKFNSTSGTQILFEHSSNYNSNNAFINFLDSGAVTVSQHNASYNTKVFSSPNTTAHLMTLIFDRSLSGAAQTEFLINGSTTGISTPMGGDAGQSGNFGNFTFYLGTRNGGFPFNGTMEEFILLPVALDNTKKTNGQNNINAFYTIY